MSAFIYSTQSDFDGPWLIDRDGLTQLSQILDSIHIKLTLLAESLIERDLNELQEEFAEESRDSIRERRQSLYQKRYAVESQCKLQFSETEYLNETSLSNVLARPEIMDKSPSSIDIDLQCARRIVRVQLKKNLANVAVLSVRTSPETDDIARLAFAEISNWAKINQAPFWQRLWAKFAKHHWFLYFFLISAATLFISSVEDEIRSQLKAPTVEMLEGGISNAELPMAIEAILRLEFKIPVENNSGGIPSWYKAMVFGGLAISVILSIRPNLVIALRSNDETIRFWRWWMKLTGITVPGSLFAWFLWPRILEAFQSAF